MATKIEPASPQAARQVSYQEFLTSLDDNTWREWVGGEVVPMSPITHEHQQLSAFLIALLQFFVETRRLGLVLFEPFQMKTGPDLAGRSPDILFLSDANRSRLQATYLEGPADVVVEILSSESRARDRGEKFCEYEQGGVREYWLIDPVRRQAEFHQLGPDGVYRAMPIGTDGIFRSIVLDGLWLRIDWLWERPLPTLLGVLKEWGLV
jgi:Uma2 family endonuclease